MEYAERLRLSRELHDQVGQNLSAMGINLNIIRTLLPEGVNPQILFRLEDSIKLVEQTGEQIRDVTANLRPLVLDEYGLVPALRTLGDQFSQRTGIEITVNGEDHATRLGTRLEHTLFRIAQEALTNVAKHAQAKCVSVKVETDDEKLRLEIIDDGIGFDVSRQMELEGSHGWGILIMIERAEAVGGLCWIESCPNHA